MTGGAPGFGSDYSPAAAGTVKCGVAAGVDGGARIAVAVAAGSLRERAAARTGARGHPSLSPHFFD